jgi:hypothetical protein
MRPSLRIGAGPGSLTCIDVGQPTVIWNNNKLFDMATSCSGSGKPCNVSLYVNEALMKCGSAVTACLLGGVRDGRSAQT